MPPIPEIEKIQHIVFYQYAQIIARSSFRH